MEKVLVVNDCRLERRIMKDLIMSIGYEVEICDDISCIATLDRFHPDILIANQTMDYIQGDELIRFVKDKYTDTRCYLSSCSRLQKPTQDNDIDGCFQTPISSEELQRLLRGDFSLVQSMPKSIDNNPISLHLTKESSEEEILTNSPLSFCPFCGERFLTNSSSFTFCPFCGGKLP